MFARRRRKPSGRGQAFGRRCVDGIGLYPHRSTSHRTDAEAILDAIGQPRYNLTGGARSAVRNVNPAPGFSCPPPILHLVLRDVRVTRISPSQRYLTATYRQPDSSRRGRGTYRGCLDDIGLSPFSSASHRTDAEVIYGAIGQPRYNVAGGARSTTRNVSPAGLAPVDQPPLHLILRYACIIRIIPDQRHLTVARHRLESGRLRDGYLRLNNGGQQ